MLRRLAVAAASVALVLLLGEAVLALAGMRPTQVRSVSADEYAALPGMFAPRQDVWNVEKPALPHRIRINPLGFRGSETTRVPAYSCASIKRDGLPFWAASRLMTESAPSPAE